MGTLAPLLAPTFVMSLPTGPSLEPSHWQHHPLRPSAHFFALESSQDSGISYSNGARLQTLEQEDMLWSALLLSVGVKLPLEKSEGKGAQQ